MRTGPAILAMLVTLLPAAASAYDGLALGARAPGTAPVSLEETDTAHARAVDELTTEMFEACRDGEGQACSTGPPRAT